MDSFFGLLALLKVAASPAPLLLAPVSDAQIIITQDRIKILSKVGLDLDKRWEEPSISQGFSDNMLLALYYLKNPTELPVKKNPLTKEEVAWLVPDDFVAEFWLQPGEVFAFHKNVLPQYKDQVVQTMASGFMTYEGYQYVAGLGGNGVCHLASLITWAASEAGLTIEAPADHSFARIEGVPREYWTSIRYAENGSNSKNQNLYVTNTLENPVRFVFERNYQRLSLTIKESSF